MPATPSRSPAKRGRSRDSEKENASPSKLARLGSRLKKSNPLNVFFGGLDSSHDDSGELGSYTDQYRPIRSAKDPHIQIFQSGSDTGSELGPRTPTRRLSEMLLDNFNSPVPDLEFHSPVRGRYGARVIDRRHYLDDFDDNNEDEVSVEEEASVEKGSSAVEKPPVEGEPLVEKAPSVAEGPSIEKEASVAPENSSKHGSLLDEGIEPSLDPSPIGGGGVSSAPTTIIPSSVTSLTLSIRDDVQSRCRERGGSSLPQMTYERITEIPPPGLGDPLYSANPCLRCAKQIGIKGLACLRTGPGKCLRCANHNSDCGHIPEAYKPKFRALQKLFVEGGDLEVAFAAREKFNREVTAALRANPSLSARPIGGRASAPAAVAVGGGSASLELLRLNAKMLHQMENQTRLLDRMYALQCKQMGLARPTPINEEFPLEEEDRFGGDYMEED